MRNPTHLFLLHRLKDLDDTFLVVSGVDPLENLAVLAPPHLAHHFIVVLAPVRAAARASCSLNEQRERRPQSHMRWAKRRWPRLQPQCAPPVDRQVFIVPVLLWVVHVGVCMGAGPGRSVRKGRAGGGGPFGCSPAYTRASEVMASLLYALE